jgi:hypothetical protein
MDGFSGLLPDAVTTLEEAIALSDDVSLSLELLLASQRVIIPKVELTLEAVELAERLDDARCLIWVAGAAGRPGNWGDGLPLASRAVRVARDRALIATLPYALQAYASQLVGRGRFDLAYASAEEGWRLAQDLGLPLAASWTLADLATIDLIRGDVERVREHLAQLQAIASSGVILVKAAVGRALGMLDLGIGRPSEALERLLAAIEPIRLESNPVVMFGVPDAVEAAAHSQRLGEVRSQFERLRAWIGFPNPARRAGLTGELTGEPPVATGTGPRDPRHMTRRASHTSLPDPSRSTLSRGGSAWS